VVDAPGRRGPDGDARVLLVVEQLRRPVTGGIGTYIGGVLGGLAGVAAEHQPVPAVTLHASRPPRGADPIAAFGFPLVCSRLPRRVLTRAWDRAVVHAPGGFPVVHSLSLDAAPVRRAEAATSVVTVHDLAWRRVPDAYPPRGRRWHEAALQRALRRAARFVVPSDLVARDLVAAGANDDAVVVIALGSDHLPAPDDEAAGELLGRLGVDGEFLLSVGTLEPRKNLGRVFAAYAAARRRLPAPWPLVVVGPSGWGEGTVPVEGVVFGGRVAGATLAALYRRTRVLLYLPLVEGFGLPPLEAMVQGAPVVASPVPSTAGAALEVAPTDVAAITEAIVEVATVDSLRRRLAAAGAAHARALTWRRAADAHLALWRSVA